MAFTSIQKTYEQDVVTLFFQFTAVGGAGSLQTLNTANGITKGIKSITYDGSSGYTFVLLDEVGPITAFVGKVIDLTFQSASTNAINYSITSFNASTKTIVINTKISNGSGGGILANALVGGAITFSTSAVY